MYFAQQSLANDGLNGMVLHCYIHIWSYFTEGPSNQMVKQYHICPVFDNCWFLEKHTRQLSWTVIWTFREIKLFKRELSISTVKKFLLLSPILDNFQLLPQFLLLKNPVQTNVLLVTNNSQHFWILHPFAQPVACC